MGARLALQIATSRRRARTEHAAIRASTPDVVFSVLDELRIRAVAGIFRVRNSDLGLSPPSEPVTGYCTSVARITICVTLADPNVLLLRFDGIVIRHQARVQARAARARSRCVRPQPARRVVSVRPFVNCVLFLDSDDCVGFPANAEFSHHSSFRNHRHFDCRADGSQSILHGGALAVRCGRRFYYWRRLADGFLRRFRGSVLIGI